MSLTKLTKSDLDRLADLTNMKESARAIVHDYFVGGLGQVEIAEIHDVSKQRVNYLVSKIRNLYNPEKSSANGYMKIDSELPIALAEAIEGYIQAYQESNVPKMKKDSLNFVIQAFGSAKNILGVSTNNLK